MKEQFSTDEIIAVPAGDLQEERDRLAGALFELVDAVAGLDRPWDLEGHGFTSRRAEEICELAALGSPKSLHR